MGVIARTVMAAPSQEPAPVAASAAAAAAVQPSIIGGGAHANENPVKMQRPFTDGDFEFVSCLSLIPLMLMITALGVEKISRAVYCAVAEFVVFHGSRELLRERCLQAEVSFDIGSLPSRSLTVPCAVCICTADLAFQTCPFFILIRVRSCLLCSLNSKTL